ncbi:MAG TPA: GtrA family protein [Leptospiraceae bacterium]|nr:GtrA family protein [Leptospiraceae bacterium]HRG76153.1 GtrA family protein [Leptospiraceae bacterium]
MKRELVFFIISGCSAVLTDLISYFLLVNSLGHDYAKALSFVLGSFVAFILNKYLTFQKKESSIAEIIKFSILYAITLGANVAVNHGVILITPEYKIFAFLCATGTSTILNFIGQKFWVFK